MSEHTPGPWFLHNFAGVSDDPQCADVTVSCDHPATITVAYMGRALTNSLDEAIANARLIAAAPDMAEVLRRVVAEFGDYHYATCPADQGDKPGPCDCFAGLLLKDARAVIAKATEPPHG